MRRAAVTGIGIISALGRGRDATLAAVRDSRVAIRRLTSIDVAAHESKIGGEVSAEDLGSGHREYDRFVRLAMIAAAEAAEQALLGDASLDRTRIGTLIGTGLGGSETLDAAYERLYGRKLRPAPMTIPRAMYNAAASGVSAEQRALGPVYAIVSACASGAHAIGQASHWIRSGLADLVIAGGADAPLAPGIIRGWESLRVLAIDNDEPSTACRPFSADRKGLVLAEGAAVLILEELESAKRRGARILGEVVGAGMSSDAGHLTDPSVDGAARAIAMALRDAAIDPAEIGYINAHGTATRANDPAETAAIHRVFGPRAKRIPVSSTKAMHGHAMGASGAIEIALSLIALNEGVIPPTMNYREPDAACDLDCVPNASRPGSVELFLSNSFGFGGMNGVVALRTAVDPAANR